LSCFFKVTFDWNSIEQLMQQQQAIIDKNRPLAEAASQAQSLLAKSIGILVQLNLTCDSITHCTSVGTALKPCGGLIGNIAYSKRNKYANIIEELGRDAQAQSRLQSMLLMIASDCAAPPYPTLGCIDGVCIDCTYNKEKCAGWNSSFVVQTGGIHLNFGK
jgi:streptomycin 6-kinase